MRLNNLLAAPGFQAWTQGEPLDAGTLLFTADGRPRVSIMSIAHLGDAERMFFVTLLLNEIVAWMRSQSGTSSLRAILYMDEVFGFLPPVAAPPSKVLLLTLLKQARAFGLGVVLVDPEPGGPGLQGAVQRGDLVHRPAADGAGPEPGAGRPAGCGAHRGARWQEPRRDAGVPRQAHLPPAQRARERPRADADPLGHGLPARAADPGGHPAVDGGASGGQDDRSGTDAGRTADGTAGRDRASRPAAVHPRRVRQGEAGDRRQAGLPAPPAGHGTGGLGQREARRGPEARRGAGARGRRGSHRLAQRGAGDDRPRRPREGTRGRRCVRRAAGRVLGSPHHQGSPGAVPHLPAHGTAGRPPAQRRAQAGL